MADPNTSVTVDLNGKYFSWRGDIIGSGEMRILSETKNKAVFYALNFLTPWKSIAEVDFTLKEKGGKTLVIWTLESGLPWYLFWMKKTMETYIKLDYNRGLHLLKDFVEKKNTCCGLKIEGVKKFEGFIYIGHKRSCKMSEFEVKMKDDFQNIFPKWGELYGKDLKGNPFTLYHKFDAVKNKVIYEIGIPLKKKIEGVESPYFVKILPKMEVYSILHKGAYRHLKNAWAVQMMHQRAKKIKKNKNFPPFEIYLNSPENTKENALETAVYYPIR